MAAVAGLLVTHGQAFGQSPGHCSTAAPPGIAIAAGRSSPYLELSSEARAADEPGSVLVRGGIQVAGRADLPVAGAWRARVEGSRANWRVVRQTHGADFDLVASRTIADVQARQIVAQVGRQGGRSPACGYVLAGGGLYSLRHRGASARRPGVALTAGVEIPTGDHGAVQFEAQLHMIDTRGRPPIDSSHALAASISVGWGWRF